MVVVVDNGHIIAAESHGTGGGGVRGKKIYLP